MTASTQSKPDTVVLVVEDEPVLRASMVRGLGKLAGVTIIDAGTVEDGSRLIRNNRPSLMVSDLDLPDGTGIDLVSLLDQQGVHVPVIFVSGYLSTFRPLIPSRANIDVREKPLTLDALRELVQQRLATVKSGNQSPASEASETPFSATDFIQLSCMGRHSVSLRFSRDGASAGEIRITSGEIWSARDTVGGGPDAFRRLAFDRELRVACSSAVGEAGPRNMSGSWEEILLEAARRVDEGSSMETQTGAARPNRPSGDRELPVAAEEESWDEMFAETTPASADLASVPTAPIASNKRPSQQGAQSTAPSPNDGANPQVDATTATTAAQARRVQTGERGFSADSLTTPVQPARATPANDGRRRLVIALIAAIITAVLAMAVLVYVLLARSPTATLGGVGTLQIETDELTEIAEELSGSSREGHSPATQKLGLRLPSNRSTRA